jgi:hypothetical protein
MRHLPDDPGLTPYTLTCSWKWTGRNLGAILAIEAVGWLSGSPTDEVAPGESPACDNAIDYRF